MSNQKFDHPADRRLVTGISGTGKTTLWMDLVDAHDARFKFIYDHQGEYRQRRKVRKYCTSADDLIEALEDRREVIVFDPIELCPGNCIKGFEFLCEFVFEQVNDSGSDEELKPLLGKKLVAVDELQIVTDQRVPPVEFLKLCETGRRYQVDIIAAVQAPNRLHNSVRNQLTWIATFRHSDDRALDYLVDQGFDADQVRSLGEHDHLWKDLKTGQNNFTRADESRLAET